MWISLHYCIHKMKLNQGYIDQKNIVKTFSPSKGRVEHPLREVQGEIHGQLRDVLHPVHEGLT